MATASCLTDESLNIAIADQEKWLFLCLCFAVPIFRDKMKLYLLKIY